MLEAIGSNRTIQLKEGNYILDDRLLEEYGNDHIYLKNVHNLKMIGKGDSRPRILGEDPAVTIMVCEQCFNIQIDNLEMGHYRESGWCQANVVDFVECEQVHVNNSVLFGTGETGIIAVHVVNFVCTNIKIKECSMAIIELINAANVVFENCRFTNNNVYYYGFHFEECTNVLFDTCIISKNKDCQEHYSPLEEGGQVLIQNDGSKNVLFSRCKFEDNQIRGEYNGFISDDDSVTVFENVVLNNNIFINNTEQD